MPTAFVPRETAPGETRVAATPDSVKQLVKAKLAVQVERGAGERAGFPDAIYAAAGAQVVGPEAWSGSELVLKVQPPSPDEAARLARGARVVSFVVPSAQLELVRSLAERGVTSFAMDLVPRITRAQAMDALSSQATVAGYKAVLLAAAHSPRLCPLMMTAAGTVPSARAFVFGAGVAGLMAIATAKRLGCTVEATDVRAAAKEQVESLGARFVSGGGSDREGAGGYAREQSEQELAAQRAELAKRVAGADLVITTALIPGKPAPLLVTEEMVRAMKPGAVIVDLAVESGGNCALSVRGEIVQRHGVTLIGIANLPATVPQDASTLYARNVLALVKLMLDEQGQLKGDLSDDVLAGCLLVHGGEVKHAPTAALLGGPARAGARA